MKKLVFGNLRLNSPLLLISIAFFSNLFTIQANAACRVFAIVSPENSIAQNTEIRAALLSRGYLASLIDENTARSTDVEPGEHFIETITGSDSFPEFTISLYEVRESFDLSTHLPHLGQYADSIWSRTESYQTPDRNPSIIAFARAVERAVGTLPRCESRR